MTRVKICGCMRVEDALVAKEAGADFVGLVFAPTSRRRLSAEQARAIVDTLGASMGEAPPPADRGVENDVAAWFRHGAGTLERRLSHKRPLTVGVFEDQSLAEINAIADECGLDLVQLSGRESWADCRLANRPVVKAIEAPNGAAADDVVASLETGSAVACLLDGSRGHGIAADHAVAAEIAARLPLWLAGGLTPENVSDAVRAVRPWAVDVSSGVETDGAKDAEKIRAFVLATKGATVA